MMEANPQARLLAIGSAVLLVMVISLVAARGLGSEPAASQTQPTGTPGPPVPPPDALRSLARTHGLRFGSAVQAPALARDARYGETLVREFSMVTPEDALKWARVEPREGTYDWAAADRIIDFAVENGLSVYGHTLLWGSSVPEWLEAKRLTRAQMADVVRRHITDEVSRYRDRVWAWDVVNEPMDSSGRLRSTTFSRTLGPDYIADAFRWARAADPKARLFINEFDAEGINAKSNGLYNLVKSLKAKGVPIDGVGFQSHWELNGAPSTFLENLQRFAALGVDVAITETDVSVPKPTTAKKLRAQAAIYRDTIASCLAVPRCVSFTVWGFTDRYSWIPYATEGASDAACLFDAEYRRKPSYTAVAEVLAAPKN